VSKYPCWCATIQYGPQALIRALPSNLGAFRFPQATNGLNGLEAVRQGLGTDSAPAGFDHRPSWTCSAVPFRDGCVRKACQADVM